MTNIPTPLIEQAKKLFFSKFPMSSQARIIAGWAPGRVNIIGEHTDYNGGLVLPAGIDRYTAVVGSARSDEEIHIYSSFYNESASWTVESAQEAGEVPFWAKYPLGVFIEVQQLGQKLGGLDAVILGSLPQGGGLSSSASLEVAFLRFLQQAFIFDLLALDEAVLCQRAENITVGVSCGIMDQATAVFAQPNQAVLLDCANLTYSYVPIHFKDASIVVINSGVKHNVATSEYRKRRALCEETVELLSELSPSAKIRSLRDVTLEDLDTFKDHLTHEHYIRARHVITENMRVQEAVQALKAGDLERLGHLLFASHASLRDLYEVSSPELDILVDLAKQVPGVYGARLVGAGFGGCTINLVSNSAIPALTSYIQSKYYEKTGIKAQVDAFTLTGQSGKAVLEK